MIKKLIYIATFLLMGFWAWPAQASYYQNSYNNQSPYGMPYQYNYRQPYPCYGTPYFDPNIEGCHFVNGNQHTTYNVFGLWQGVYNMDMSGNPFGYWYGVNNTGGNSGYMYPMQYQQYPNMQPYPYNMQEQNYYQQPQQPASTYYPQQPVPYTQTPTYNSNTHYTTRASYPITTTGSQTSPYFVAPTTGVNKWAGFGFASLLVAGVFVVKKRKWIFG